MSLETVILGNQQAIKQCLALLDRLTTEQYSRVSQPYAQSSIGQHIRHVLDVYHALLAAIDNEDHALADYDQRRRGAAVETNRVIAQQEFAQIERALIALAGNTGPTALTIRTEVCLDASRSVTLPSSLVRELVFTASHAVHHFALIAMLARLQGVDVDPHLGVAPATASFLRQEGTTAISTQPKARSARA